ncbi:uncharacterized protein LOC133519467 [Cydia pomonella]|uniref:uncharacterized protein LOC133519467 n=1 Tax=Cydia pomonella TaxID=82600 RepID=UPI002ADDB0B4|nr:uncharacterized protein LOC133519467 [Cydia pomonella]
MNNTPITFSEHFKLLGIIMDQNLTFVQHSEYAIKKAQNIFKRLCIFIKPTWGIQSENVKIIYRQVIEPIVTYAAEIWHTATNLIKVRDALLSLQRGFAIKIIHGFRTLPTIGSIALAGLTPLPLRIKEIASSEHTKRTKVTKYLPEDILYDKRIPVEDLMHPAKRPEIKITEVFTQDDLDPFYTADMNRVFTDGSKHDEAVGAAVVIYHPDGSETSKKYKLHSSCTVFQAECLAIEQACQLCLSLGLEKSTVFSDSKSALNELMNRSSTNAIISNVQKIVANINEQGHQIHFSWIKAHQGLLGNEAADAAAKHAATLHKQPDFSKFPLSYHLKNLRKDTIATHEQIYLFNCENHRLDEPDPRRPLPEFSGEDPRRKGHKNNSHVVDFSAKPTQRLKLKTASQSRRPDKPGDVSGTKIGQQVRAVQVSYSWEKTIDIFKAK